LQKQRSLASDVDALSNEAKLRVHPAALHWAGGMRSVDDPVRWQHDITGIDPWDAVSSRGRNDASTGSGK